MNQICRTEVEDDDKRTSLTSSSGLSPMQWPSISTKTTILSNTSKLACSNGSSKTPLPAALRAAIQAAIQAPLRAAVLVAALPLSFPSRKNSQANLPQPNLTYLLAFPLPLSFSSLPHSPTLPLSYSPIHIGMEARPWTVVRLAESIVTHLARYKMREMGLCKRYIYSIIHNILCFFSL